MNFDSLYTKYNAPVPYYEKSNKPRYFYDLYNKRDLAPTPMMENKPEPKPNPMEKQVTTQRSPPPPTKSGMGARGQMNY